MQQRRQLWGKLEHLVKQFSPAETIAARKDVVIAFWEGDAWAVFLICALIACRTK